MRKADGKHPSAFFLFSGDHFKNLREVALLRYGQTIRLRPSLNQKPPAFRRDRGNRRQFTFEAVLFRQEHDPSVRQDHTAGEGVCDVIIDRLTGPAAGTDRHALRNANADPAAATC